MNLDIKILQSIEEGTGANNAVLLDIADFCEKIADIMQAQMDNIGSAATGGVDVNQAQKKATSSLDAEADAAAGAVNSILSHASKLGNLKNVGNIGTMISGIGRGLKEFIDVLKLGGPTLRLNRGAMESLADSINYFAERIAVVTDVGAKNDTILLFKSMGAGIKSFSENLWSAAIKLKTGKMAITWIVDGLNHFAAKLEGATALTRASGDSRYGKSMLESMLGAIGSSVHSFAANLWTSAIKLKTGRIAIIWIADSINLLSNRLQKSEKALSGIDALQHAGMSIFKFATLTALAIPFLALAIPGLVLLGGALLTLNMVMKAFDERMVSINSLKSIGITILIFSASLAASALILSTVANGTGMMGLAVLFGSIAVLGLTFKIFGDELKAMEKGALAIALMGLSLIAFSFSLAIASAVITTVGIGSAIGLLFAVGGFALVFGLAGLEWEEIALGALAMAAVGVSLIVFGYGLKYVADSLSMGDIMPLIGVGGLIAVAGIGYSVLGADFEMIGLGALAVAAIGVSLAIFGWGLTAVSKSMQGVKFSDMMGMTGLIAGLGVVFSGLGFPPVPILIGLGAAAAIAMGDALYSMAAGMKAWVNLPITDAEIDSISDKLTRILTVIPSIFGKIGEADGKGRSWSFTRVLFGTDFGSGDVERGINLARKYAETLGPMAEGIMKWQKMTFGVKEIEDLSTKMQAIVGIIPSAFGEIGAADAEGSNWSFTKVLFGADFGTGHVEKGIELAEKYANTLKSLADGVMSWKDKIYYKDIIDMAPKLEFMIGMIPSIFGKIGAAGNDTPWSVSKDLFGADFSTSNVETGMELALKYSKALKPLADGVVSWKDKVYYKDLIDIGGKLEYMVNMIPAIFGKLGATAKESQGWFTDSNITKGIDKASQAIPVMKGIIDFMNSAKDINVRDKGMDIGIGIMVMMNGLTNFLAKMAEKGGKMISSMEQFRKFTNVFGIFGNNVAATTGWIDKLLKQADPLSKIADTFERIADSMAKMEKSTGYMLGNTGWESPNNNLYTATQAPRPQAPVPAYAPAPVQPYQPALFGNNNNNNQGMEDAVNNMAAAVAAMTGGINLSPESAARIGTTIADALINYLRQHKF